MIPNYGAIRPDGRKEQSSYPASISSDDDFDDCCYCTTVFSSLRSWFMKRYVEVDDASTQSLSPVDTSGSPYFSPSESHLLLGPPQESSPSKGVVREVNIAARHTVSFLPQTETEFAPISFRRKYSLGKMIGEGTSSSCFICRRLEDNQEFACKVINLKRLYTSFPRSVVDRFKQEIHTLELLDHTNIIRLEDHFCTNNKIYIVLELIKGGELYEKIVEEDGIAEYEARRIFKQLAQAVKYMHKRGVIHRDIKPENVMITRHESSTVKIIDFGFSKVMDGPFADSFMGTGGFLAPELVSSRGSYSSAVDIWSLGVTLYVILSCCLPFDRSIDPKPIHDFQLSFSGPEWTHISESAKHLLRCMLQPNPDIRYTADQILKHKWLEEPKSHLLAKLQLQSTLLRSKTWTTALNPQVRYRIKATDGDEKSNCSDDEGVGRPPVHGLASPQWRPMATPKNRTGGVLLSRDYLPLKRSTSVNMEELRSWKLEHI